MRLSSFAVRSPLALAASIVLVTLPMAAQLRESIEVRVLELEVSVLDREGKAVEGLTRDDFVVRVGKREVPVANFFAVRKGIVVTEAQSETQGEAQTPVAEETSIPTSLVIFIDDLHLSQHSHARAVAALRRYVSNTIGHDTTATLLRYNRTLDVRIRPTERAGAILRELDQLSLMPATDDIARERRLLIRDIDDVLIAYRNEGRTLGGETPDTLLMRIERYAENRSADVDHTLRAIERAIELASAFSGRKVLLYVSDGLPQVPGLELFEYFDRALQRIGLSVTGLLRADANAMLRYDRTAAFRRLTQTAQRANVAFFSFDAGGLRSDADRGPEAASTLGTLNTTSMTVNDRSGLQFVAQETGGQYVTNENSIDTVLARMSEQFTSYYSVGIQPPEGDIRITVRNRPELRVIAARRRPPRTREDKLEQHLRSRLYTRVSENPLDATLGIGVAAMNGSQCIVPVRLTVPQPELPEELTPRSVELRMVMLNELNDESAVQTANLWFEDGRVQHIMKLRIRPEKLILSIAVSNPLSGETSYLQADIDGTTCK